MSSVLVLKKPVFTEKSLRQAHRGKYLFEVAAEANKHEVEKAIRKQFGVEVLQVNMMVRKGKLKRIWPTRRTTLRSDRKLALVTINPKQKITVFEEFMSEE